MRFYVWINSLGEPISKAWEYIEEVEIEAEYETPPVGGFKLSTGTKKELKVRFSLDESDFIEDEPKKSF